MANTVGIELHTYICTYVSVCQAKVFPVDYAVSLKLTSMTSLSSALIFIIEGGGCVVFIWLFEILRLLTFANL